MRGQLWFKWMTEAGAGSVIVKILQQWPVLASLPQIAAWSVIRFGCETKSEFAAENGISVSRIRVVPPPLRVDADSQTKGLLTIGIEEASSG